MKTLPFIKMHGLGNDYVYIDCFPMDTADILAKADLADLARMPMVAKRACAEMPSVVWVNTCTRAVYVLVCVCL